DQDRTVVLPLIKMVLPVQLFVFSKCLEFFVEFQDRTVVVVPGAGVVGFGQKENLPVVLGAVPGIPHAVQQAVVVPPYTRVYGDIGIKGFRTVDQGMGHGQAPEGMAAQDFKAIGPVISVDIWFEL